VLLHLIDYMLNNQTTDSSIDFLMKNTRIHILGKKVYIRKKIVFDTKPSYLS
jgi:hypothetical protein